MSAPTQAINFVDASPTPISHPIHAFRRSSFYYNGNTQSFIVPENTFALIVSLSGGGGGSDTRSTENFDGGYGGFVRATLSVTPGSSLCIYVGWCLLSAI